MIEWIKELNKLLFGFYFFLLTVIMGMILSQFMHGSENYAFLILGIKYPLLYVLPTPGLLSFNILFLTVFTILLLLSIKSTKIRYLTAILPGIYWLFIVFLANVAPWD